MNLNRAALVEIRERSGVSRTEFAIRVGVDRTLIHRIEDGQRRAMPIVMRTFADALACPLLVLMEPEERLDE